MFENFKLFMSKSWTILRPFILMFVKRAAFILLMSATEAVLTINNDMPDASGKQKRRAAFDLIKTDLSSRQIEISTSLINSAIEIAVQNAKINED